MKRFLNLLCYTILSTFNLALSTSQVSLDQLQNHKNKQKTINANRKKQIKNKSNDTKRDTCNSLNRKNNTGENIQDSIMIQKFKKMYPENDLLIQGLEVALISLAQNYSWDIKNKCYDLANKLKQEREKISSSPQKYYNDLMNQPEMVKAKENVSNILKSADPVKLITDVLKLTYKAHIKLDSALEYGIKKTVENPKELGQECLNFINPIIKPGVAFAQGAKDRVIDIYNNKSQLIKDPLIGLGKLLCIISGDTSTSREFVKLLQHFSDENDSFFDIRLANIPKEKN